MKLAKRKNKQNRTIGYNSGLAAKARGSSLNLKNWQTFYIHANISLQNFQIIIWKCGLDGNEK